MLDSGLYQRYIHTMKRGANNGGHEEAAVEQYAAAVVAGRKQFNDELADSMLAKGDAFDAFQRKANEAFGLVANATNWKYAVDALVNVDAQRLGFVLEAVVFFTGSVPSFQRVSGGFLVKARGYYAAVGA